MKKTTKWFGLLGAVSLCALAARPAEADLWTASGSDSDGTIDAEANFTISSGQIQVTITNLLSPTTSHFAAGQAVRDLIFTISTSPGTNGTDTAAAQLVDVNDSNGSVTDMSGTPGRWVSSSTGASAFQVTP